MGETANEGDAAHLDAVDDGCGCVETWEHRSELREE